MGPANPACEARSGLSSAGQRAWGSDLASLMRGLAPGRLRTFRPPAWRSVKTDAGFLGAVGPIWLTPGVRATRAREYMLLEPRRTSGGGGQHPAGG